MLRLLAIAHRPAPALLHRNAYLCYVPHLMTKHYSELTMRATRRTFLNKTVLNQSKDVIHAEIRKPTDLVLKLKQAGKCPGVIVPYSKNKEEEVDVVLPGKAMKTRTLSDQYRLERVHVRAAGKDYLCVLAGVKFNLKNFIEKVVFHEYVPGKANYLRVPVLVTHLQMSKFFHGGYGFKIDVEFVDIISYNHEYPTRFNVDISYVNPDRPYRIGDLANTFPPGIILNPKVDPNKEIFVLETPETGGGSNSAEQILENINYGKAKTDKQAAGGATPAAGGKGEAAKGDAGKAVAAKPDAKAAAPAKKK
jgi:hypothetical protein